MSPVLSSRVFDQGDTTMLTRLARLAALRRRAPRASTLGLFLALFATGSAFAQQGTPEQRRACTPDVYRLCAGEIPNARAITACLRRQKASLSQACAAVFEQ
jgi:hypothetical protein